MTTVQARLLLNRGERNTAGGLSPVDIEVLERKTGVVTFAGAVAELEVVLAKGLAEPMRRVPKALERRRGTHS